MKNLLLVISMLFAVQICVAQDCGTIGDTDRDGLCNDIDPCPEVPNPNPVDSDGDGVFNACDNCRDNPNADQADADGDGIGDACDTCDDPDNDGVCGANDRCPGADDRQDRDGDGIPDACDDCNDMDGDGICDNEDNCDNNQEGQPCDDGDPCTVDDMINSVCACRGSFNDSDGDGICDEDDACPGFDDLLDFDEDGVPDGCDDDPVCRTCDTDASGAMTICVFSSRSSLSIRARCEDLGVYFDSAGAFIDSRNHCGRCTCEDRGDNDTDGDGVCDGSDPCPEDPTITETDGCPCDDRDTDGDGVCDTVDRCPDSDDNLDKDGDGIPDACDDFSVCIPSADDTFEWIESITFNQTTMTGQSSTGYFAHSEPNPIPIGEDIKISVFPALVDDVCEVGLALFIDLNNDDDFDDPGEELANDRGILMEDVMPSSLAIGSYRVRAILNLGRISSACETDIDGEVEDFFIQVVEPEACTDITESFMYAPTSEVTELSGGMGWDSPWTIDTRGSHIVAILEGPLDGASNNRLGLINQGSEILQLSRSLDASLAGSSEVYLQLLLNRVSGVGMIDFSLNDISFGINEEGRFFLGDIVGPEITFDTYNSMTLRVELIDGDNDIVTLTIENEESTHTLDIRSELGTRLENLSSTVQSADDFLPLIHITDEIIITCDDEAIPDLSSLIDGLNKKREASIDATESSSSIMIWPNPVQSGYFDALLLRPQKQNPYVLLSPDGYVISEGELSPGVNRIGVKDAKSGLYYLTLPRLDGATEVKKILVGL